MKSKSKNLLRVSELAQLAGVTLPTIKHYLNEGLIPKPVKTGKTMAYYDRSCVKRILLIKKLQNEKFLPLDVIKRVIDHTVDTEEELSFGHAVLRSDKMDPDVPPASEEHIDRRAEYSIKKIKILEENGLIVPTVRDDGKYYDPIDLKLIGICRRLEEIGLPFDYILETIKVYLAAIQGATNECTGLFMKTILGELSMQKAADLIAQGMNEVDELMPLIRQKLVRAQAHNSIIDFNEYPKNFARMLFLPLRSAELPETPPEKLEHRIIHLMLTEEYGSLIQLLDTERKTIKPFYAPALIIADVLRGDAKSALETVKELIPCPTARNLDNLSVALAYMQSLLTANGLSNPLLITRKLMLYLKRIEITRDGDDLIELIAKYVCGCYYSILPELFGESQPAIKALLNAENLISVIDLKKYNFPEWLNRTITYEIFPAIQIRIHRFMAYCLLRTGHKTEAVERLDKLLLVADPGSEYSEWARLLKFQLEKGITVGTL